MKQYPRSLFLIYLLLLSGSLAFVSVSLAQTRLSTPNSSGNTNSQALNQQRVPTAPETVVISIGDIQITAREVEKFLEGLPPQFRPFYSGRGRRQLADHIVNNKLLMKEAERRNLQQRDDVQLRINIARESILTVAARSEIEKEITVAPEGVRKYLADHLVQYEQAKVKRIVICSTSSPNLDPTRPADRCFPDQEARAKAEEIKRKLIEGADFEEMAAKFSSDSLSFGKGGDLGFIRRGHQLPLIVPPLEEVIFSIKVGTISEVIPTPFGYEIVKVEERRAPKLEEVSKDIESQLRKQKVENILKEMRDRQPIKINEAYFAPKVTARSTASER